jgi:hypothetical protein
MLISSVPLAFQGFVQIPLHLSFVIQRVQAALLAALLCNLNLQQVALWQSV